MLVTTLHVKDRLELGEYKFKVTGIKNSVLIIQYRIAAYKGMLYLEVETPVQFNQEITLILTHISPTVAKLCLDVADFINVTFNHYKRESGDESKSKQRCNLVRNVQAKSQITYSVRCPQSSG